MIGPGDEHRPLRGTTPLMFVGAIPRDVEMTLELTDQRRIAKGDPRQNVPKRPILALIFPFGARPQRRFAHPLIEMLSEYSHPGRVTHTIDREVLPAHYSAILPIDFRTLPTLNCYKAVGKRAE